MSHTCFDVRLEHKVAHVELKRPEAMNSMIPEFWDELPEIVRQLDDGGEARAIVLSSTGRHFCAGMDLAVFTSNGQGPDANGPIFNGDSFQVVDPADIDQGRRPGKA